MSGFPLDRSALQIDMQRLFAERTEWFMPWLDRVLPIVAAIASHAPERTLCTRFIPPEMPEQMTGAWQDYYRHWRAMTRDTLDPRQQGPHRQERRCRPLPVGRSPAEGE